MCVCVRFECVCVFRVILRCVVSVRISELRVCAAYACFVRVYVCVQHTSRPFFCACKECVLTFNTGLSLAQAKCHRNSASFMVAGHKVVQDPACAIPPFLSLVVLAGFNVDR